MRPLDAGVGARSASRGETRLYRGDPAKGLSDGFPTQRARHDRRDDRHEDTTPTLCAAPSRRGTRLPFLNASKYSLKKWPAIHALSRTAMPASKVLLRRANRK